MFLSRRWQEEIREAIKKGEAKAEELIKTIMAAAGSGSRGYASGTRLDPKGLIPPELLALAGDLPAFSKECPY